MLNTQTALSPFFHISHKGGYIGNIAWCNTGEAGYRYFEDRWGFLRIIPSFPNTDNWWGSIKFGWVHNLFTRGNVF